MRRRQSYDTPMARRMAELGLAAAKLSTLLAIRHGLPVLARSVQFWARGDQVPSDRAKAAIAAELGLPIADLWP